MPATPDVTHRAWSRLGHDLHASILAITPLVMAQTFPPYPATRTSAAAT